MKIAETIKDLFDERVESELMRYLDLSDRQWGSTTHFISYQHEISKTLVIDDEKIFKVWLENNGNVFSIKVERYYE